MVFTIGLGDTILRKVPRDLFLYNYKCHYKEQFGDNQANLFYAKLNGQQHRNDHGLTIKAMAASVGVAPATWRKYEKDESFPSEETLWKFCGVYHVNREWLNTSEGEIYTDGYKPGDPLGEPIDYREMILQELTKG